jgi:hypothetical protein
MYKHNIMGPIEKYLEKLESKNIPNNLAFNKK